MKAFNPRVFYYSLTIILRGSCVERSLSRYAKTFRIQIIERRF